MREIVLDTETTGLDPAAGHRLIEIGCIELHNHVPTGRSWHKYLNPERDIPPDAVAVHGLTEKFLADKPVFAEVVEEFLGFIAETTLIIHNAEFDLKFLNAELTRHGYKALRNTAVDTVLLARQRFPGQPANLDALCRRFSIDNSGRDLHGALLDARLLADVYLELRGGRQQGLDLMTASVAVVDTAQDSTKTNTMRERRTFSLTEADRSTHAQLVEKLGENALWPKVLGS